MPNLPDAPTLARLVSNVTETMCGTTFTADQPVLRGESLCGRMVLLPLVGARKISIVLACDTHGGQALASALFGCDSKSLTPALVDDAIRELLNMVAGQVTSTLKIDQALGLPRKTTMAEICEIGGLKLDDAVLLTSHGRVDLRIWIFEHDGAEAKPASPSGGNLLRSLLRKIAS